MKQQQVKQLLAKPPAQLSLSELVQVLQVLNTLYFTSGESLASDTEYDLLKERLVSLSPDHPLLNAVGAPIVGDKVAVKLPIYMGSLDKVKPDTKDLGKYLQNHSKRGFVLSEKLDGVSLLVTRDSPDSQWRCYTRGNGEMGHEVTDLLSAYLKLPDTWHPEIMVRGEVILPKSAGKLLETSKNLRSIVSGAINAKTPKAEVLNHIQFIAYAIPNYSLSPSRQFQLMSALGFQTPRFESVPKGKLTQEYLETALPQWRTESNYDIDGIVVAYNKTEAVVDGKNPKHTVAFKMVLSSQSRTTRVTEVEWKRSKHGQLKPTVIFEEIHIDGCNINRATGIHAKHIIENRIAKGALIQVLRSGDVIPHIEKVLEEASQSEMDHVLPSGEWEWDETHTNIVSKEGGCPSQGLVNFVSVLGGKFINIGMCVKLVEAGVKHPEDLVGLTVADWAKLPQVKEKSATKMHTSLHSALEKACPVTLMVASNLLGKHFGLKRVSPAFEALLKGTTSVDEGLQKLRQPAETLIPIITSVDRFSDKLATKLAEGIRLFIDYLDASPILRARFTSSLSEWLEASTQTSATEVQVKQTHPLFTGKSFLFTGFRNPEYQKQIEALGGQMRSSLSGKLDYLVHGGKAKGKLQKAQSLGVTCWTQETLITNLQLLE